MKKTLILASFIGAALFMMIGCSDDNYDEVESRPKTDVISPIPQIITKNKGNCEVFIRAIANEGGKLTVMDASGEIIRDHPILHDCGISVIIPKDGSVGIENGEITSVIIYDGVNLTSIKLPKTLIMLTCGNCESLKEVDISKCTKLKIVTLNDLAIEELDVPSCPDLTRLNCSYNKLKSLHISSCPKLILLSCFNNLLTSLDVSVCPDLVDFYCGENKLTSLDVSKCNKLSTLFCGCNDLTSLDLSQCKDIIKLECAGNNIASLNVSSFLKLAELSCSKNQMKDLDISKCPNLTKFSCFFNQLTSLDISSSPDLYDFDCGSNNIESIALPGCVSLKYFECISNSELKTIYIDDVKTIEEVPSLVKEDKTVMSQCTIVLNNRADRYKCIYDEWCKQ